MRNGLAWLTLGIGWVLFSTVSCGKDEATSPGGTAGRIAHCEGCRHTNECAAGNICKVVAGTLGVCATAAETSCCDDATPPNCYPSLGGNIDGAGGGSGGGGVINNGGKSGKGGSGGSGATTSVGSRLGQACVKDADCGVDSGMTCLLSDGVDGMGPAKGMCTAACSNASTCLDIWEDSYCYPLVGTQGYCIEGCMTGALGAPKCHERTEVACTLIGLVPREGASCEDSNDCEAGELCDSQDLVCGEMITGCIPTCAGDFDCGDGQFCDFASGLCTDTKPTGLPLGSFCDPRETPDPCNGFCLSGSEPDEGECSSICVYNEGLVGCGWDGTGVAETPVCLYSTLVAPDPALGDLMLCGTLCDCNSQCNLSTDICIDETEEKFIKAIWGREGYCRPLASGETMADTVQVCPDGTSSGGTGGEGGQPSGSGGTAGDTGQSGGGGQAGG